MHTKRLRFARALVTALCLVTLLAGMIGPVSVLAEHTPSPASVTLVGSLQSVVGCGGDWDPGCAASHLNYDASDDVW